MLTYFRTARHFPFVLMLGDNLYDDDYEGEFSRPYKPLLDRGVKFYAALGNHDRDLEIHFKPFNMGDRDHYSFDEGNARFAVLNSNHPADPPQAKWLDRCVHRRRRQMAHRLLSPPAVLIGTACRGEPRGDPAGARAGAHAQSASTSSSAAMSTCTNAWRRSTASATSSRAEAAGTSTASTRAISMKSAVSEHHFMVIEIAGDRLFYEAITPAHEAARLRRALAAGVPRKAGYRHRRVDGIVRQRPAADD